MEIRVLSPSEFTLWEQVVHKSSDGTLFHTPLWLQGVGVPFQIYGVFKKGVLVGGFVIGQSRRIKTLSKLPLLTPYWGLVTVPNAKKYVASLSEQKAIASCLAEYLKKHFISIGVRFSPDVVDMQPFIWSGYSVKVRYTYIVDINDLESTWQGMDPKRRNDIRKAENAGYRVSRDASLEQLLHIVKQTLLRQNVWSSDFPSIIKRHDELLFEARKREIFGVYNSQEELVGGVYLVWDHKRSYYLLGGYADSSTSGEYRGVPALALWHAMQFSRNELGLQQFDLEGSMVPGIESFFRKFGGTLFPTFTVSWTHPCWLPCKIAKSGWNRAWQLLRRNTR